MAFRLPTFNLLCNISIPGVPGTQVPAVAPYRLTNQACQLTYGQRSQVASASGTGNQGTLVLCMNLLLPPLTDIRGPQDVVSFDSVEVPAGSGRWYYVFGVDDIGKGFSNEHRSASIYAIAGTWAPPYP